MKSFLLILSILPLLLVKCTVKKVDNPNTSSHPLTVSTKKQNFSDNELSKYLSTKVEDKVFSDTKTTSPLTICYYNKNVVALLHRDGILIYSWKDKTLQEGINISSMGFAEENEFNSIVVCGNEQNFFFYSQTDNHICYRYDTVNKTLYKAKMDEVKKMKRVTAHSPMENREYTNISDPDLTTIYQMEGMDKTFALSSFSPISKSKIYIYDKNKSLFYSFTLEEAK